MKRPIGASPYCEYLLQFSLMLVVRAFQFRVSRFVLHQFSLLAGSLWRMEIGPPFERVLQAEKQR